MTIRQSENNNDDAMIELRSAQQFAQEHWNRAAAVLSARPSLMTPHVLLLVLKNRPPAHVVAFMLDLNPRAADIQSNNNGPTALQVAVRHNASVAVIRLVIEACPLALVATHSGQDPLMYAKIWRREEPELIHLLSQPLSYWAEQAEGKKLGVLRKTTITTELPAIEASPSQTAAKSSKTKSNNKTAHRTNAAMANDEEMNNIKTIAATIVRAQKRQVRAMQNHKSQVEQSLQEYDTINTQERLYQLDELEKRHQQHFKSQLIALDMKEKRMMARVKRMEDRVNKTMKRSKQVRDVKERRQEESLQRRVDTVRSSLDQFQLNTDKRLDHVELRLEHECRVNDYFRSDTRMQMDQLDFRASAFGGIAREQVVEQNDGGAMVPVVYATPYVVDEEEEEEIDSVVPLCPKPFGGKQPQARTTRKRYPKRRRRRRHLLGPINF